MGVLFFQQDLEFLKGWNSVGLPRWLSGKESACPCRRSRFDLRSGNIPWRRKLQPTPVFLPGESHGQICLAGYSPQGHKELYTTQRLTNNKRSFVTERVIIAAATVYLLSLNSYFISLLLLFCPCPEACQILVLCPGTERMHHAVEVES